MEQQPRDININFRFKKPDRDVFTFGGYPVNKYDYCITPYGTSPEHGQATRRGFSQCVRDARVKVDVENNNLHFTPGEKTEQKTLVETALANMKDYAIRPATGKNTTTYRPPLSGANQIRKTVQIYQPTKKKHPEYCIGPQNVAFDFYE